MVVVVWQAGPCQRYVCGIAGPNNNVCGGVWEFCWEKVQTACPTKVCRGGEGCMVRTTGVFMRYGVVVKSTAVCVASCGGTMVGKGGS